MTAPLGKVGEVWPIAAPGNAAAAAVSPNICNISRRVQSGEGDSFMKAPEVGNKGAHYHAPRRSATLTRLISREGCLHRLIDNTVSSILNSGKEKAMSVAMGPSKYVLFLLRIRTAV